MVYSDRTYLNIIRILWYVAISVSICDVVRPVGNIYRTTDWSSPLRERSRLNAVLQLPIMRIFPGDLIKSRSNVHYVSYAVHVASLYNDSERVRTLVPQKVCVHYCVVWPIHILCHRVRANRAWRHRYYTVIWRAGILAPLIRQQHQYDLCHTFHTACIF